MDEVKLIDRDHDEYLKEVFGQDLPEEFTVKDKVARVNKLQKDLIRYAEGRRKKFDKLYGLPPFTLETAKQKIQSAEDAWNSKDPIRYHKLIQLIVNGGIEASLSMGEKKLLTSYQISGRLNHMQLLD